MILSYSLLGYEISLICKLKYPFYIINSTYYYLEKVIEYNGFVSLQKILFCRKKAMRLFQSIKSKSMDTAHVK